MVSWVRWIFGPLKFSDILVFVDLRRSLGLVNVSFGESVLRDLEGFVGPLDLWNFCDILVLVDLKGFSSPLDPCNFEQSFCNYSHTRYARYKYTPPRKSNY